MAFTTLSFDVGGAGPRGSSAAGLAVALGLVVVAGDACASGSGQAATSDGDAGDQGVPRLHIETSDATIALRRRAPADGDAAAPDAVVCTAPCDRRVPSGDGYYFGGDGMPNSDELSLSEGSGEVTAVVDPGNDGVRIGGAVLLALGCAQMGLGTGLVVAASLPNGGGGKGSGAFRDWGLTTLGLGALVAASGVGMLWLGRTDFELQRGASATRSARARGARWWLGEF